MPLSSSVCAYAFARLRFPGKELIFALVLGTMMIPGSVIQIPIYVMYSFLGIDGNPVADDASAAFGGGAMNIFLLRQFIRNIPSEIESAAKIDGASTFRIYLTIVIPLVRTDYLVRYGRYVFLGMERFFRPARLSHAAGKIYVGGCDLLRFAH